jgi:hypothetical protein
MTTKIYLKVRGGFKTDRFLLRLSPINGHQTLFYPSKDKPDMRVEIIPNEYPSPDRIESIYSAEVLMNWLMPWAEGLPNTNYPSL